ncbi:MAG: TauD/TfdA family dioxygenase [Myxococcales bacterium]|nr:TauD/TfdA family dioxygenase [Myxococcales bacterium]
MSTEIHRERIDHPIAWSGSDFRDKDAIAFDLSTRQVAALEDIVMRTAALPRDEVSREHCGHIELDRALQGVYEEVIRGRGLVIVRGFPVDDHSIEENERIYWAFCTHFGPLMSHNSFGHRMVRVREEVLPGGVQPARGTKSRAELAMHNDAADIFALLCVHRAEQGGESQFSSGPAAHNAILESRPDLLPILYRGFPHHRRSEQPDHQPAVTPYDVPIFSNVNQTLCINFTYSSILPALHELGREFTDQEVEAIDFLRAILVAQQLELELEPGEAVIVNNYAMCHSRSDFTNGDTPERCRLVLRAWMEVSLRDRRLPVGREFFHMENAEGRLGYDPVPGREGRISQNDYNDVSEDLANLFKAAQAKPRAGTRAPRG